MRLHFFNLLLLLLPSLLWGQNGFETSLIPSHYIIREKPILNIALVYYGSEFQMDYLDRIAPLLSERFYQATQKQISLNIVVKEIMPYVHNIKNYPDYAKPYVTDTARLQRIWYFDNFPYSPANEVYELAQTSSQISPLLPTLDAMVVITGAQFNALGFTSGRISMIENPSDFGWRFPDGGSTKWVSDYHVVDELIHEIGHALNLEHTSEECMNEQLTLQEYDQCCERSPSRNDIMSYCRSRELPDKDHYNKFENCSLEIIKNSIVPALLSGGSWKIENLPACL